METRQPLKVFGFSILKKGTLFPYLFVYICSAMLPGKTSSQYQRETFKCWFGKPLSGITACSGDLCPVTHVCVKRFSYYTAPNYWEGCCPRGNGTCHSELQQGDPGMLDFVPRTCTTSGDYHAHQCHFRGCFCAMPDGTPIEGTFYRPNVKSGEPDCERIVSRRLSVEDVTRDRTLAGLLEILPMVEELSFDDLGMRGT